MDVRVTASKLQVGRDSSMSRDDAVAYAQDQVGKVMSIFDVSPKSARVVLSTEGSETDPVQKVDVTLTMGRHTIVQSAHSRSIKKAIDRACEPLRRQVQRQKTRLTDARRSEQARAKHKAEATHGVLPPDED